MDRFLYPTLAVVAWLAFGYRLLDLHAGGRTLSRWVLCAQLAMLAAIFTVATPAVWARLDQTAGAAGIAALLVHVCVVGIIGTGGIQLLGWVNPPEQVPGRRRRRLAARLLATTGAAAAMVALFAAAAPTRPHFDDFFVAHAREPGFAGYLLVYVGAIAAGLIDLIVISWPYVRMPGRAWLRRALRIAVAGYAAGLLYCAARTADVVAALLHVQARPWAPVRPLAASTAALLIIGGLTLPALGPRLSALRGWGSRHRAYRCMYPLWSALCSAVPTVALNPLPRWPLRGLDQRLYRQVIEVSDARVALRGYFVPAVAARARRLAERAGLDDDAVEAVVEAAWLRAAVRARKIGRDPGGTEQAPPPAAGADLAGEVARLVTVASAYATSRIAFTAAEADAAADAAEGLPVVR